MQNEVQLQQEQILKVQSSSENVNTTMWWTVWDISAVLVLVVMVGVCICVCKPSKKSDSNTIHHAHAHIDRVSVSTAEDDENEGFEDDSDCGDDEDDKTGKTSGCHQGVVISNDEHSVFIPCMISK